MSFKNPLNSMCHKYYNWITIELNVLTFEDLNIKTLTLKNSINENYIKLNFENFPYLGIWSKPTGAPFICIEPWFGVADDENSNQNFEDKKGIITLEKDEIFSCFYIIEI